MDIIDPFYIICPLCGHRHKPRPFERGLDIEVSRMMTCEGCDKEFEFWKSHEVVWNTEIVHRSK